MENVLHIQVYFSSLPPPLAVTTRSGSVVPRKGLKTNIPIILKV